MNELRTFLTSAYDKGVRIRIANIRNALPGVSKEELDEELKQMQREELVVLWNNDDPLDETEEDKKAAIDICGEQRTIAYFE